MANKTIKIEGIGLNHSPLNELQGEKEIMIKGIDMDTNEQHTYTMVVTEKQLTPFLFMSLYQINKSVFKIPVMQELERIEKINHKRNG